MSNLRVFVYHHTHWDREWWGTLQAFRFRLVELIDELLLALDNDPDFHSFLLDGQTIVLEDYLEIRPENQEKLIGYIREGRIQCGPWYILPDEFLVSAEAHVRNLWLGSKVANRLGFRNLEVGYLPDTFGHISQMPQILKGFGLDSAMVWRGLGDVDETFKQEFLWTAPSGTEIFTHWFPEGYYAVDFLHFDNPNKTYDETFGRVRRAVEGFAKRATTNCVLLPYGGDHRTIDRRLPRLIEAVNREFAGFAKVEWSTTKDYIDAVKNAAPQLSRRVGELRGTGSDLLHLLPGVLSSRMYLKQRNFEGQTWLERFAEPMSALAHVHGHAYEQAFLWKAWEKLIQNHPHDSICGCSTDEVHREMYARFAESRQIAEAVTRKSVERFNADIDTRDFIGDGSGIVVHNTLNWSRTDVVRCYLAEGVQVHPGTHQLVDMSGNEVPFQVETANEVRMFSDKGAHRIACFTASDVPALGYNTYRFVERQNQLDEKQVHFTANKPTARLKGSHPLSDVRIGDHCIENEYLLVQVTTDGSLTMHDKVTGEIYEGLNVFEDSGDAGDTYNYSAPLTDTVLRSTGANRVHVTVADVGPAHATLQVALHFALPSKLSPDRLSRSDVYNDVVIRTFVTLQSGVRRVSIRTVWDNNVEDHRLRVLFPLGKRPASFVTEGHFDVVDRLKTERNNGTGWPETVTNCKPQQGFASVSDGGRGLTIVNRGLPEVELLDDQQGSIAVTLLRAVGWLSREDTLVREGGAGPEIQTPDAQVLGRNEVEYAIVPHQGDWLTAKAYQSAHSYLAPLFSGTVAAQSGKLPLTGSLLSMEGDHTLLMSTCKKAESTEGLILRFWNVAKASTGTFLTFHREIVSAAYVDLKEENRRSIEIESNQNRLYVEAGPAEIVTLEVVFA